MNISTFFYSARILGLGRRQMVGVVALGIGMTLFEAAGVMMMVPALEYVQNKGDFSANVMQTFRWRILGNFFSMFSLPLSLGGLLLIAFIAVLFRQLMQYAQRVYTSHARYDLTMNIRRKLFGAVLAANLSSIESESTGRLVNDFTIEAETATSAIFYSLQLAVLVSICTVYLGSLIALSPAMTLLSVVLIMLTGLFARGFLNKSHALGQATMETNQQVGAFLVERIHSLRLIRLSGTERAEQTHADRLLAEQALLRIRTEKISGKLSIAVEPVSIGFAFFCLWFGSTYLNLGIETLGVFLVIVLRLVPIGKDLIGARQVVMQTQASLSWIEARLRDLWSVREIDPGQRKFHKFETSIVFQDVHFHYGVDGERVIALNGVSFSIPAKKTTALVGPSGGGKSTLIDLLPKLRKPETGGIVIDGIPLDEFTLESLRHNIAFVPQAAQIFDVTATEYIRYGRADAKTADIESAARSASAYEFISQLPDGFDTRLGEGGHRLSGGQRQRLDLARAIARDAAILILDEPTSALDAESENEFQNALDVLARKGDTTILVIAHRLTTIAHADQIVVLEAGRITDIGTHKELLARGGWYARSWMLQSNILPEHSGIEHATIN